MGAWPATRSTSGLEACMCAGLPVYGGIDIRTLSYDAGMGAGSAHGGNNREITAKSRDQMIEDRQSNKITNAGLV